MTTEQERFWKGSFGDDYLRRNAESDPRLEDKAWRAMTAAIPAAEWHSSLECGCNRGRNLATLRRLRPDMEVSLIEINTRSYEEAMNMLQPRHHFNGSILESAFPPGAFDLAFTCGVLIHIAPEELLANCRKLCDYARRFVLIAEYFSHVPASIDYRGEKNMLFKRDFGGFVLDNFDVQCLDYGFLWGREYAGAFDDITWWLFRKK